MKRLLNNYWFRWFAWTFIIGAAVLPIFLLVIFITMTFQAMAIGQPVTIVTNPFVDFTTTSGPITVTGNAAWLIAILLFGFFASLIGLVIAVLKRAFWK